MPSCRKGGGNRAAPKALLDILVPDDYAPKEGELDNIVYLTLKYTVGWNMRLADKQVVLELAQWPRVPIIGREGISRLVRVGCEYAWDHIAGKPEGHTPQKYFDHMSNVFQVWYNKTTQAEREKV